MASSPLDFEVPPHLREEFFFRTAGILPPHGILFGFNTFRKLGEQARNLGGKKAVLVTDPNIVELGFAGLAREDLEKEGWGVEVFDRTEPEPHLETAAALYDFVKAGKPDLLVGLGGGSSLDLTKLISIAAANDVTPEAYVRKPPEVLKPALKKILIPTTSGTGSEVSRAMVIAVGKEKQALSSHFAYPEIAIIDPGLTVSMPPRVTAVTGIDALSHAVDTVMNKERANPLMDSIALGGIELISRHLRRAVFTGRDLEARYYLSLASTMSMMAMTNKGPALYSHGLGYVLALFQPIAHGVACGLCLPYTMAFNLPVIEDRLALIARAMGDRGEFRSPLDAGWQAVNMVYELTRDVRMPVGLKEAGFRQEDVPRMAEVLFTRFQRKNPRPLSREDGLALLEMMWEGKIRPI